MNQPNITSNNLDQAPKTTNARYQRRLDAMKDVIYEAFDQRVNIYGDKSITNWLDIYKTQLPLDKINLLKNGEALAIELKREPANQERWVRNEAPSIQKHKAESLFTKTKYKLAKKDKKTPLQPGEKTIQLIISRATDPRFPENKNFKISAVEFQIPGKNSLLPAGVVFEKELTGKEFENAIQNLNLEITTSS